MAANPNTGDDPDGQALAVTRTLERLSPAQVVAYERIFVRLSNALLNWRCKQAADLAIGFTEQDDYVSFRDWLVYLGRDRYERFKAHLDSLVDLMPRDVEATDGESLEYVADDAYRSLDRVTAAGTLLYADPPGREPSRASAALRARYPRLTAAYGTSMALR